MPWTFQRLSTACVRVQYLRSIHVCDCRIIFTTGSRHSFGIMNTVPDLVRMSPSSGRYWPVLSKGLLSARYLTSLQHQTCIQPVRATLCSDMLFGIHQYRDLGIKPT